MFPGLAIMITVLCLNILSEGMTDAMARCPKAAIKASDSDLNSDREADRLVANPVLAYQAQAASLEERLAQLKIVESQRTDRAASNITAEPILEVKNLCIKFPRHGDVNVVDNVSFMFALIRPWVWLANRAAASRSRLSPSWACSTPKAQVSGEVLYQGQEPACDD